MTTGLLLLASAWVFFHRTDERGRKDASAPERTDFAEMLAEHFAHFPESNLPRGAVSGEAVLFFENAEAMERFIKQARKERRRILGKITALNAVRVQIGNKPLELSRIAGLAESDFNFSMRVPVINPEESSEAETRELSGGGRVPVGASALAQLGVSAEAFAASGKGDGVKIAILDTGIYAEHAALQGVKISQIDVVGGAADTPESLAHGTAVASLIAGNGVGEVFGMATNAELLGVRVFDGNGEATAFTLAQGIVAAVDAGAQLINISAGVSSDSAALRAAVVYAQNAGATLVAAGGNDGVTALAYPAAYSGVIAVGAVDATGASAPFSNEGQNLSVVAPGVGVYAAGTADAESRVDFSGTSASAPLVTGALAAAYSNATGLPDRDALNATADDLGVAGVDTVYGSGLLNYERLTRPVGASVSDVAVNDFYVRRGSGGNTGTAIGVTMQNRGTLWETCTYSLKIVFSDGAISLASGNLNLQPGESVGQGVNVPAEALAVGVGVIAEIYNASGDKVAEKSVILKDQNISK